MFSELVRNADQAEPEEVPEEEGVTERSEVNDTEPVEMEVVSIFNIIMIF